MSIKIETCALERDELIGVNLESYDRFNIIIVNRTLYPLNLVGSSSPPNQWPIDDPIIQPRSGVLQSFKGTGGDQNHFIFGSNYSIDYERYYFQFAASFSTDNSSYIRIGAGEVGGSAPANDIIKLLKGYKDNVAGIKHYGGSAKVIQGRSDLYCLPDSTIVWYFEVLGS